MWIKIWTQEGNHFNLPVPLFLLGSPAVLRLAARFGGEEVARFAPIAGDIARELRRYIRNNGHFTLVEVESSEGDSIEITV